MCCCRALRAHPIIITAQNHLHITVRDTPLPDKKQAQPKTNKTYLDIQIQGKFKQPPKGTVYFGVQLVDKERMANLAGWKKGYVQSSSEHGMINTRQQHAALNCDWNSLCRKPTFYSYSLLLVTLLLFHLTGRIAKILLKSIQAFAPILYSYGNDNEYPYIVSPLEYNAETFLSTSPGEPIPRLGPSLQDGRNIPQQEGSVATLFNTQDTYTFRFSSKCLDLLEWQLRIGSYTVNLEKFWGKSSVRLVAYDAHEPLTDSSDNTLVFCAEVQPFHERVQNSK